MRGRSVEERTISILAASLHHQPAWHQDIMTFINRYKARRSGVLKNAEGQLGSQDLSRARQDANG
jgi:hypothetical protein